ncbi:restriction endonuclease subunit S [Gracilibacillus sp. YIM 98692]|uniref:restriction endonuclease subunit S n=1 Tax=Gracilibacillus sp. YIM 98692 TaxID=2663532 RepID=UPI0013CF58B6|nr:restriction endonuclease subunit S [Gracilibacillus sp. YIM 98692]
MPEEEQPYEVPENWVWIRLGSYFEHVNNQVMPEGDEKYLGLEHLGKNGGIIDVGTPEGLKSKKVVFKAGDVLYGKLRPYLNKHAIANFEGIASTDILIYRSRFIESNKLLDKYLGLPLVVKYANENSSGINLPRISPKKMNRLPIPLPPLEEQDKINNRIEKLINKIDRAEQLIKEAKETFELRRAAILDKAFCGKLGTNKGHEMVSDTLSKNSDISLNDNTPYDIPDNWLWVKTKSIAKWGSGGTPSRKKSEYYNGEIPWLKTGELRDNFIVDSKEKITEDAIKNSSAKLFPKGSVAVAMYGATIGRTGIFGIDASTNQACAVGIPEESVDPEYMFYYFQSQKQRLIERGKGGAQPNISQTIIKDFPFPLPPLEEQKRITQKVKSMLRKLESEYEYSEIVLQALETLKNSILSKAFKGELGTNDKKDESSIELLIKTLQKQ